MGTRERLEKLIKKRNKLEELYKQKKEAFTKGEITLEEFRKFRKKLKRIQRRVRKLQAQIAKSESRKEEAGAPAEEEQQSA